MMVGSDIFVPISLPRLGEARNRAMDKSKGEFLGFLDCDDIWLPQKLAQQLGKFRDQEVGLVFCDTIFFNHIGKTKQLYKDRPPPRRPGV